MERLNLTELKGEVVILKGKLAASEFMNEEQKTTVINELKDDINNIISLIDIEISKENKLRNIMFDIANSI